MPMLSSLLWRAGFLMAARLLILSILYGVARLVTAVGGAG